MNGYKRCSLLQKYLLNIDRMFVLPTPERLILNIEWPQATKLFTAVIHFISNRATVFVSFNYFRPSLIFARKVSVHRNGRLQIGFK
jgi:hypothetical protein